jgi:hypothetical protein
VFLVSSYVYVGNSNSKHRLFASTRVISYEGQQWRCRVCKSSSGRTTEKELSSIIYWDKKIAVWSITVKGNKYSHFCRIIVEEDNRVHNTKCSLYIRGVYILSPDMWNNT